MTKVSRAGFRASVLCLASLFIMLLAAADAGATGFITVGGKNAKQGTEPSVTVLSEDVSVSITNQMVKTRVMQVFKNNTDRVLEGEYLFPLPFGANIVSFATWDDGVKINGVIMEKVKAKKIYEDIVSKLKDPGLLENVASNTFHAKIFPIPAYGTKRLELEYVEYLPLLNGLYCYTYPLDPNGIKYPPRRLSIDVSLSADFDISNQTIFFENMSFTKDDVNSYRAGFKSAGFDKNADFKMSYSLDLVKAQSRMLVCNDTFEGTEEVYFLANFRPAEHMGTAENEAKNTAARAIFLIDSSFSMKKDKLDAASKLFSDSVAAEGFSTFNAYLFSSKVSKIFDSPVLFEAKNLERVREKLERVLPFDDSRPAKALSHVINEIADEKGKSNYVIILISDGKFFRASGKKDIERALAPIFEKNQNLKSRIVVSTIGVGNDCQNDRMSDLANLFNGEFRAVSASDDSAMAACLAGMLTTAERGILRDVRFEISPADGRDLYPDSGVNVNAASECFAVGKLFKNKPFAVGVSYYTRNGGGSLKLESPGTPSKKDWYIPLLWGRARVNYLTAYIEQNGENDAMKKEIINLSKRFNFVTKYTSFLAVPPSILRPRRIKPGDPEITIKAPGDSKFVAVNLPFGETIKASYDATRSAFVARFTAPAHIKDGEYTAMIIIVDKWGRERHEDAKFTIDSTPPTLYASLSPQAASPGDTVKIKVNASADTASINAKTPDGEIIKVKYDPVEKLSTASYKIPQGHSAGKFQLEIEAIDHAGNRAVKYLAYTVNPAETISDKSINKIQAGDENEKL